MQVDLNNVVYNSRAISTHLPLVFNTTYRNWILDPDFLAKNEIMFGEMFLVPDAIPVLSYTPPDRGTIHGFSGDIPYYFKYFNKFPEGVKMPIKQIAVNRYWHIFFEGVILTNHTDYEIYDSLSLTDQRKILDLCNPKGYPQEYATYLIHNDSLTTS